MFSLEGKTALVTGASGGLGSEISKALAAQGARLALSGSNEEKLKAFAAELGGDHVTLVADLSNAESVDGLVPAAVEALGKLDILVNNAGITRDNLAMRMKDEEWEQVIKVNLEAAYEPDEMPLGDKKLAVLENLVTELRALGFSGILQLDSHIGDFCYMQTSEGGWTIGEAEQPVTRT